MVSVRVRTLSNDYLTMQFQPFIATVTGGHLMKILTRKGKVVAAAAESLTKVLTCWPLGHRDMMHQFTLSDGRWGYWRKHIKGECRQCGSTFHASSLMYRFCSDECQILARKRYKTVANASRPRTPIHTIECVHCGTTFKAKRMNTLYCSVRCRVSHHRRKVKPGTQIP